MCILALAALQSAYAMQTSATEADPDLADKTLVVWAAPATLDQRGGTALTIDNGAGAFDGIVFGELEPGRWMPGSNSFTRTASNQSGWAAETTDPNTFVQIAIVYRGKDIAVYRDGQPYAQYTAEGEPQTFGPQSVVLFGRRHLDALDKENTFAGKIKDARIYNEALDQATIAALVPGKETAGRAPWAWWPFCTDGLQDRTGRFNEIMVTDGAVVQDGCLVLAGNGATLFTTSSPPDAKVDSILAPVPREWSLDGPVPDAVVRSTRLLREKLLADPWRPGYHFCVPEDMGLPGDPNGAFYHDGRYHLMYLYDRSGSGFCWGHISSNDLVHWRHHPDAIGPGDGDEGCFSGGAFVDDDDTVWLSYWMLWGAKGIGLASGKGPDFDTWTKPRANPVIPSTEWGVSEAKDKEGNTIWYGTADPSNIWKKDGRYYMLTGSLLVLEKFGRADDAPLSEQGDRLYLFVSDDLMTWEYLHVFYERNPEWTDRSEDNMCPSFFPLPMSPHGGPPSDKHLLLFISHNKGCQYYIGAYRDDRFFPESHGRMTWVDNTYFAPEALMDDRGRQIMWAWLTDNPADEKQRGWSGVYGLPRTLWLGDDGTLRMAPVPELESLRERPQSWTQLEIDPDKAVALDGISGRSCELRMQVRCHDAARCGVKVRTSPGGEEETLIYYDAENGELVFDSTRSGASGQRPAVERAPFRLASGETLDLRVFIDNTIIEVYANDRQAICRRVYPDREDSTGVVLFSEGGKAFFDDIQAWRMAPSNPY
jgi:beta-fructofuranosidase